MRSTTSPRPPRWFARPTLERLEDRTLLAAAIPNAVIDSVSDDGRFVLYTPLPANAQSLPGTVPLMLRDQRNPSAPVDFPITNAAAELLFGNAAPAVPTLDPTLTPSISHDGNFVVYVAPGSGGGGSGGGGSGGGGSGGGGSGGGSGGGAVVNQVFLLKVNQANVLQSGAPFLVSHDGVNVNANGTSASTSPVVASFGSSANVAFASAATNLMGEHGNASARTNVYLDTVTYNGTYADSTVLVSANPDAGPAADNTGNGDSSAPSLSANGTRVAFQSSATNLLGAAAHPSVGGSNVYLYTATGPRSGSVALVSHAANATATSSDGNSSGPVVSRDGSAVAFVSAGTNLLAGESNPAGVTNVFLYRPAAGTLALVSGHDGSAAVSANGNSDSPSPSADGGVVAYRSDATDLSAAVTDDNNQGDVFAYTASTGRTVLASASAARPGHASDGSSVTPVVDPTGQYVAYSSNASDLVAGEVNPADPGTGAPNYNVYRLYLPGGGTFLVTGQIANGRQSLSVAQANGYGINPLFEGNGGVEYSLVKLVGGGVGGYATEMVSAADALATVTLTLAGGGPPNTVTVASDTPPGVIATLAATAVDQNGNPFVGQVALPVYALTTAGSVNGDAADNSQFALEAVDPATGRDGLDSLFTANLAVKTTYSIRLQANARIGPVAAGAFVITVVPSAPGIGAYDPGSGTWYLRNEDGNGGPPDAGQFAFGGVGWKGVSGSWAGGPNRVGVVDTTNSSGDGQARWYLATQDAAGTGLVTAPFAFGLAGWIPVAGDWTGSGHTGIGMFDPMTGNWYLENTAGSRRVDFAFNYGLPNWKPVAGDWDGDGRWGVGAVDPSGQNPLSGGRDGVWFLANTPGGPADAGKFAYGDASWKPVAGDWDGNGTTTVGVVDPMSATWYLRNENSSGGADAAAPFTYGLGEWQPVSGRWVAAAPRSAGPLAAEVGPAGRVTGASSGAGVAPPDAAGAFGLVAVTARRRAAQDALFSEPGW